MFDHFSAGKEISKQLAAQQYGHISELLADSLYCGSATEALMGMRWHLSKFLETRPILNDDTRIAIDELLNEINISLT